jgi:predicted small metal-binding protein
MMSWQDGELLREIMEHWRTVHGNLSDISLSLLILCVRQFS